ncbi:hypothetical protein BJI67_10525 [Acidihalobacter aeolianus]|uniref:Hydrogenase expression/formation protein n=1 Tax=Acidihalobacter aeolianus TaxID=2792603 RepID=A0A1D8K926_9GAMM|nr:hypothetical protein [Acidihalobacter aeolianus]AOV17435.1 hypothetical protein BJI67_10525 [Acidihalobacter aeolianus]
MSMTLIDRLTDVHDYPRLDADNFEQFVEQTPQCALFFTEDPTSFPESNDVAVILPELAQRFGGSFTPAVVARTYEREVSKRYGVREWPTLVFLRRGEYLGAIARVQNWSEYLEQIQGILTSAPQRLPTVGIPVVAAASQRSEEAQS